MSFENDITFLLLQLGESMSLIKSVDTNDFDPRNPETTQAEVPYSFTGVPINYTSKEIGTGLVQVGDVKVYLAKSDSGAKPEVEDIVQMVRNGVNEEWRVVSVIDKNFMGEVVCHVCQCRK